MERLGVFCALFCFIYGLLTLSPMNIIVGAVALIVCAALI